MLGVRYGAEHGAAEHEHERRGLRLTAVLSVIGILVEISDGWVCGAQPRAPDRSRACPDRTETCLRVWNNCFA